MKNIFGYLLITISILLILFLLMVFQDDIVKKAINNIPNLFKNKLDIPTQYRTIGVFLAMFLQSLFTISLFIIGRKLTKT